MLFYIISIKINLLYNIYNIISFIKYLLYSIFYKITFRPQSEGSLEFDPSSLGNDSGNIIVAIDSDFMDFAYRNGKKLPFKAGILIGIWPR